MIETGATTGTDGIQHLIDGQGRSRVPHDHLRIVISPSRKVLFDLCQSRPEQGADLRRVPVHLSWVDRQLIYVFCAVGNGIGQQDLMI
ncbi:hypothetical protein [Nonomuraea rosea]|uniref:hypothetical protein n=1 Tax=Nonomuraea rosea TaxID=638574 RepID=UPI0031E76B26